MSLLGLVLSGGKSMRMGKDKGSLVYDFQSHLDQRSRCAKILSSFCDQVLISVSNENKMNVDSSLPVIVDSVQAQGPAAGILSAHQKYPDAAIFVLACDFPYASVSGLAQLIENRRPELAATVFVRNPDSMIEPLFAIWEVQALKLLKIRCQQGFFSAKQVLEHLDVQQVVANDPKVLINVNSWDERSQLGF